jgi:hypothetical protein
MEIVTEYTLSNGTEQCIFVAYLDPSINCVTEMVWRDDWKMKTFAQHIDAVRELISFAIIDGGCDVEGTRFDMIIEQEPTWDPQVTWADCATDGAKQLASETWTLIKVREVEA